MKAKAIFTVALTCVLVAAFWAALVYGAMYALMAFVLMDSQIGMGAGAARMLAGVVFFIALLGYIGHGIKNDAVGRVMRQWQKGK